MNEVPRRPFYAEYAWAFDLLIDRLVRKECAAISAWLVERGVLPGAEILEMARFGAYDPSVAIGATDRVVVVAQRIAAAA